MVTPAFYIQYLTGTGFKPQCKSAGQAGFLAVLHSFCMKQMQRHEWLKRTRCTLGGAYAKNWSYQDKY